MTVFVADAVLVDAQQRAQRLPLSLAEQRRWQEVAAYRAARRPEESSASYSLRPYPASPAIAA